MEEKPHIHQVFVDGRVIYEGNDWEPAFFEAARNTNNGTIEHVIDGQTNTVMGPNVRLTGGIAPVIPPVQSVMMSHPAFIRGYKGGLATIEPRGARITDSELVSLLKTTFETAQTEDDLYYHVGNIIGVMDAQTQHTLYRVVSVYSPDSKHPF